MGNMEFIITTEDQLTKIIDSIVEKHLSAFLYQQPVTLPLKQGNYTSKDLRELFGISSTSIWNWERKGVLHPVIIQRKKFYKREDIEQLIKQKTLNKRA